MNQLTTFFCFYFPKFLREGDNQEDNPVAFVASAGVFLIGVVLIGLFLKRKNYTGIGITLGVNAVILAVCNWHWASIIVWVLTLLVGWMVFKANHKDSNQA